MPASAGGQPTARPPQQFYISRFGTVQPDYRIGQWTQDRWAREPYNLAMRSLRHRPIALLGLILIAAGIFSACATTKAPGKIHVLTWQGEVNPVMARYIERGMDTAER